MCFHDEGQKSADPSVWGVQWPQLWSEWPRQEKAFWTPRSAMMSPCTVWQLPWPHHQTALQWRHNRCDGVSNHQPHDCWFNRSFMYRSKKTSMLRVTGLCEGNSPVTGEFPAQMASNARNVSIWWRHQTGSACTWIKDHLEIAGQQFHSYSYVSPINKCCKFDTKTLKLNWILSHRQVSDIFRFNYF